MVFFSSFSLVFAALLIGLNSPAALAQSESSPPASATVIVDRNLELAITEIPKTCRTVRVSMLRRDEISPGYLSLTRLVHEDQKRGRWVSFSLSPEFFPHAYSPGDVWLSCYNQAGESAGFYVVHRPLLFDVSQVLEMTEDFEAALDEDR